MRISLKSNWESRVSSKIKIYFLSARDKILIDKIFNVLQAEEKLSWIN